MSINELEEIKANRNKTEDVKYAARKAVRFLNRYPERYGVIVYDNLIHSKYLDIGLDESHDVQIIKCAAYARDQKYEIEFVSDDILARIIARDYFELDTVECHENNDENKYCGYKNVILSDDEMSNFYLNIDKNIFNCVTNEYLIVRKKDEEIVDTLRWDGDSFKKVCNKTVKSTLFGDKIKPKDVYQSCVIDSILNNTITAITGKAGSGKSLLSLITIMYLIETGKYDRLVIMFNPIKARGASDMGYYSGDAISKAMQNSIGSILTTKFGDRFAVDMLLQQDKIRLVSMADVRGMEVRNEILYISECENTSIDLLKLCLSRASSECKIVIEGDYETQTDSFLFDGNRNGLKRAIEVFKGEKSFGYIDLPNIWRSKIAELVDKM